MRIIPLLAGLAALAACQQQPATEPLVDDSGPANAAEPAPAVGPAISAGEAAGLSEGQRRTASAAGFDWTGRFANTPQLCEGGVWNIGRDRIVTDGETACEVLGVEESEGRAQLRLACTAEGMDTSERWTFVRQGEGMRVVREMGEETVEVDLQRCG